MGTKICTPSPPNQYALLYFMKTPKCSAQGAQSGFLKGVGVPIPRRSEYGHLDVLKGRRSFSVVLKAAPPRWIVLLCRTLSAQKPELRVLRYSFKTGTSTCISITAVRWNGLCDDAAQGPACGRSSWERAEA